MTCPKYELFFKNFCSETRWSILNALLNSDLSVNEICNATNLEQSQVSHHLKSLSDCNFVTVTQDGKKRIYSLNKDTIEPLIHLVKKHVENNCPRCYK